VPMAEVEVCRVAAAASSPRSRSRRDLFTMR
jgi:hypothetical protein